MVVYQKDGKNFILVANSKRGVMKISTEGIDKVEPITARVKDTAGLKYETIGSLKGVQQLDLLDKEHALRPDQDRRRRVEPGNGGPAVKRRVSSPPRLAATRRGARTLAASPPGRG